jgi:hypothetical protein
MQAAASRAASSGARQPSAASQCRTGRALPGKLGVTRPASWLRGGGLLVGRPRWLGDQGRPAPCDTCVHGVELVPYAGPARPFTSTRA